MPNVLISGATGFVGSHLLEHVLANHPEYNIVALKRRRSDMDNVKHLVGNPKIEFIDCNIDDPKSVDGVFQSRKFDKCFHLAAQSFVQQSWNSPAYAYFKPEDNDVLCDKDMFFACSEEIRLAAGYEETCVLALERSQIPHPHSDPRASFLLALEKLSTSISSGFFREYVWENYDAIARMYDPMYVEKFKQAVALAMATNTTTHVDVIRECSLSITPQFLDSLL